MIGKFNYKKGNIAYAAHFESHFDLWGDVFIKRTPAGFKALKKQQGYFNDTVTEGDLLKIQDNSTHYEDPGNS